MVKRKAANDGREDEGEQTILKYMKKVNRPYSATDVFNNLHGKYSKPSVVRALDSLAEQDELISKTYGKMQIYAARQSKDGVKKEDLETLQVQASVLEGKLEAVVESNRQLSRTLADLKKEPTTESAKALLKKKEEEISQMRNHLEVLKSGAVLVTPEDRKKSDADYALYRKEWRTRRKLFRDIFNALTEHMPGKPAEIMEELGIEEDPVSYENDTLE
ncbi:Tat binding protein 1-interacting protein-domain-containing protein [Phycomyces nitens]|nr:Tat binding protein 1-interacting protein-domain-containing protein [Phycomyces nitens]